MTPTYHLQDKLTRKNPSSEAAAIYDKEDFDTLEFRDMDVDDMIDMDDQDASNDTRYTLYLMSKMTGKDERVLRRMTRKDFMKAARVLTKAYQVENESS